LAGWLPVFLNLVAQLLGHPPHVAVTRIEDEIGDLSV
jgi:hypothetical protein